MAGLVLAFALLVSLGTWQLQRLAWKEALLAQIHARVEAPAVAVPDETQWPRLRPDGYEYRHVILSGTFENDKEALVFRPEGIGAAADQGPGYLVLTPLRLDSGAYVIVDRGFVPMAKRSPATRAGGQIAGPVTIAGLMRSPEPRNLFTPKDTPDRGEWYTRDAAAIAAHFGLARSAPFTVDADGTPVPGGWPKGGQTLIDIPNNHLGYALTWYGLALALTGVFASKVLARRIALRK